MSKIKIFGLGGLNDNGKNMYVVTVNQDIFVFDAGLKYADDKMLGVDYIIPNFDYLKENIDHIQGLFISHGHELQMGAVTDILKEIPKLKVYGTSYTLDVIKQDLLDEGIVAENLIELKPHRKVNFGKNSIFPISMTHSVPEAVGYVLNTPDGAIFYTSNFAFDPTMIDAFKTDIGKLAYIGKQGVLCLLSESVYADKKGYTSPKHRMASLFSEALSRNEGRMLFNIYDSQIYRIQELLSEIEKTDRKVIILGKNLQSTINSCIEKGYITFDTSRFTSIHNINDSNVAIIISDDREKPFSNMKRIIRGTDKFIKLNENDTVVFASQVYDGMEKTATDIYDSLAKLGINLVILSNKCLSLHASSEDLLLMLDLMQPKYYFPVIGEYRHQVANSELARQIGMDENNILLKLNGQVVNIENGELVDTDEKIPVDDILIDGKTMGDIGEAVIRDREALSDNGIVIVTATIDKITKKVLAGPEILTRGFIYVKENIDLIKEAEKISLSVINEYNNNTYIDFSKVKNGIRDKVGKYLYEQTECKPMILLVLQEV